MVPSMTRNTRPLATIGRGRPVFADGEGTRRVDPGAPVARSNVRSVLPDADAVTTYTSGPAIVSGPTLVVPDGSAAVQAGPRSGTLRASSRSVLDQIASPLSVALGA